MTPPRVYSFDSSAFIEGRKWYSMRNVPAFWQSLDELIADGQLLISEEAVGELHDIEVQKWIREPSRAQAIIHTDASVIVQLHRLNRLCPNFPPPRSLKNHADPYVIAVAMLHNATVVTEEKRAGQNEMPRIPNACQKVGVDCIRLPKLIELEDWRFHRST